MNELRFVKKVTIIVGSLMFIASVVALKNGFIGAQQFGAIYIIFAIFQVVLAIALCFSGYYLRVDRGRPIIMLCLKLCTLYVITLAFWFYIRQAQEMGFFTFFPIMAGLSQLILALPFIWLNKKLKSIPDARGEGI